MALPSLSEILLAILQRRGSLPVGSDFFSAIPPYALTGLEAASVPPVTPSNYANPANDVRRMGVVGDGTTDDTAALQRCYTVGGEWKIPPGFHVLCTAPITGILGTRLYCEGARSPGPAGVTQGFLYHKFNGPFFDLVGSTVSDQLYSGFSFQGLTFVQQDGNGAGNSGPCIRSISLSDTQRCSWTHISDCCFETVNGLNDWSWCLYFDGTANSGIGTQQRDHFISRCRFVSGANAIGSVWLNGVSNIFLSECEGNLVNAILSITGTAAHPTNAFLNHTTWATIALDYAQGVFGAGNTTGTLTSTVNTTDVELGCACTASPPTINGTRVTVYGKHSTGKWTVSSNAPVRHEVGSNTSEFSGPIGVNGVTAGPARVTGFGTPTGTGVINNFPGASATLPQCSQAIAQLIADLKAIGFYGS